MDEKIYAVWLALSGGVGNNRNSLLALAFNSAKEIYDADEEALLSAGLLKKDLSLYADRSLTAAENVIIRCKETGIDVITYWDENFIARPRRAFRKRKLTRPQKSRNILSRHEKGHPLRRKGRL